MPTDILDPEDEAVEVSLIRDISTNWDEYCHMHPRRMKPDARLRVIEQMERDVKRLADQERAARSLRCREEMGYAV